VDKGSRPVGQLVDRSPEAQPKGDVGAGDSSAGGPNNAPAANKADIDTGRSAFGNVGLPLVALAGVAMLISFALWLRRRRARAARQATQTAQLG
jgi:D-alanyl-D-alanine carboxypeptidase (penicillin-binding protein 5/6)